MEMHQVRYFMALCETLSFTRAAELCGVAQPSLTRAIQKLEEELGGQLFLRERALSNLTELGRLVRPHMEAIASAGEATKAEAQSFFRLERGAVRLGAMCTIGPARLVSFVREFRRQVPTANLTIRDAPAHDIVRMLMEGEVDCGLVALPNLPERFDALPLYRERYVVVFALGHRFEAMAQVPLRALNGEDYLVRTNCEYADHFDTLGIPDPAQVNIRYETEREDWVQAMILAGLGCAVMPEYLPATPGLATRPLVEPEIIRQVALVTVAGRRHSPALRAFLALARRHAWDQPQGASVSSSSNSAA